MSHQSSSWKCSIIVLILSIFVCYGNECDECIQLSPEMNFCFHNVSTYFQFSIQRVSIQYVCADRYVSVDNIVLTRPNFRCYNLFI